MPELRSVNSFETAVREYLKPYQGYFNYENMLNGHLDVTRFYDLMDVILAYHPITGVTVLSSGCSSGGDMQVFAERGAAKVYGVEVDANLARLAQLRFQEARLAHIAQADLYNGKSLPYAADCFDIVLSFHVIEHTQDPPGYFAELVRVLRPGGVILLELPNRYYPQEQHTLLPYFHYLPIQLRNRFINWMLAWPFVQWVSSETQYKLSTCINFQFFSADQLITLYEKHKEVAGLFLEDTFFHSYSPVHIPWRKRWGKYLWGQPRQYTTFRMVLRKAKRESA
jgi:SAM-dependent methyltransferase